MTAPRVTIVDYGMGNLLSVARAFEHRGAAVTLGETPEEIMRAERLVLPGVGAFADCVAGLRIRGLIAPVKDFVATGRPMLGICVGMQILLDEGEEFGRHRGLGVIPGRVVAIPKTTAEGAPHKVAERFNISEPVLKRHDRRCGGQLESGCRVGLREEDDQVLFVRDRSRHRRGRSQDARIALDG